MLKELKRKGARMRRMYAQEMVCNLQQHVYTLFF